MGDVVRVLATPDGQTRIADNAVGSLHSRAAAPGPEPSTPPAPQITHGFTIKVQPGTTPVVTSKREASGFNAGVTQRTDDPLDSARSTVGVALSRDKVTEDSIVEYGGMQVQVKQLVALGKLAPKPGGGGFEWLKEAPQEQPKAPQAEYLDARTEATIGEATKRLGSNSMFAVFDRVVKGESIVETNELASRMGIEPGEVHVRIGSITQAFSAQAQRSLGMDADTFATFSSWVKANRPKELLEAARKQFGSGDLSGIRSLGREFLATGEQFHPDDVLTADFGSGITAHRHRASGKIVMSIPGVGSMTFADAIRNGLISVRRK